MQRGATWKALRDLNYRSAPFERRRRVIDSWAAILAGTKAKVVALHR